jgi:cytochrome c2
MSLGTKRLNAALIFLGAAALAVCVASPAILQYRTLRFDREYREFRIQARNWVRNPFAKIEPPPIVVEDAIDTNLLRLRRRVFYAARVDPSILPRPDGYPPVGAAMGVRGSRALIATRSGTFYEVDFGGAREQIRKTSLVLDTGYDALRQFGADRQANETDDDGTGGLRYATITGLLFLTDRDALAAAYTHWNSERKCISSRVALLDLRDDWRAGHGRWQDVFESRPCISFDDRFRGNQAGGRLVEVGPGTILLAVGDFGHDGLTYKSLVEDRTTSYGKAIELHLDTHHSRVVASGLRNPQGLAVDAQGGVWSTEHGPRGGDELNLIRPGRDYGWPHVSYGTEYGRHVWPLSRRQGHHEGYEEPVYAWTPSIGVSNLIEVRHFAPEWDGDLLVLSLRGRRLSRLRLGGGRVRLEEPIAMSERLRDIGQLDDGRIVLWTDSARLVVLSVDRSESSVEKLFAAASPRARSVLKACAECHSFDDSAPTDGRIGLWGINGRRFAAGEPGLYSDALKNASGRWNRGTLDRYLQNPQRMIPGTTMPYPGIADNGVRAEVVEALSRLELHQDSDSHPDGGDRAGRAREGQR